MGDAQNVDRSRDEVTKAIDIDMARGKAAAV
jgi:hypothetical protein